MMKKELPPRETARLNSLKTSENKECNNVTPAKTGFSAFEHIPGIPVADSLDYVLKDAFVVGEPAALDFGAKEIAEDPSEVFVPGV